MAQKDRVFQILDLIRELNEKLNTSVLFITHDLGVVSELCENVIVMYDGQVVEKAPVRAIFEDPQHPYTKGLLASIPRIGDNPEFLHTIPGVVPNMLHLPKGCAFANRCELVQERCRSQMPELVTATPDHECRCFLALEEEDQNGTGRKGGGDR